MSTPRRPSGNSGEDRMASASRGFCGQGHGQLPNSTPMSRADRPFVRRRAILAVSTAFASTRPRQSNFASCHARCHPLQPAYNPISTPHSLSGAEADPATKWRPAVLGCVDGLGSNLKVTSLSWYFRV